MRKLEQTIEIEASPERCYAFMTHPDNLPAIWPSLVEVSDVEHRPDGAHAFNYRYKMAGIPLHGRTHTTYVDANRFVVAQSEGGVTSEFRWSYAPTARGTRLTCEVTYAIPATVLGKLAESVVAKLNERELTALLHNAKVAIEAAARSHLPIESHAPSA